MAKVLGHLRHSFSPPSFQMGGLKPRSTAICLRPAAKCQDGGGSQVCSTETFLQSIGER